ncbi:ribonuclease HII [Candidatus Omnitrophota bacterium]
MFYYENKARKQGAHFVIGVDEAGCGPLAGPVVAAAVLLTKKHFRNRIDDSKKLTSRMRESAFEEILDNSIVGVGIISEAGVDAVNVLKASHLAMERAIKGVFSKLRKHTKKNNRFSLKRTCILIDGRDISFHLPCKYTAIVNGDAKSISIACASIVAKVTRDRIMNIYDRIYPHYGFAVHKGYGTRRHKEAISNHGPSMIHRKTFHPVRCLEHAKH